MKKLLLLGATLFGSMAVSAQCNEIFISEYVEGWSNNKAIELYNPTDAAIDLSTYRLDRHSNGSTNADANQQLPLSGTIEPYSTFVIVIDKRDPEGTGQEYPVWDELQVKADWFANPVYEEGNTMYFNGNDALVLRNNGAFIDVFGRVGEDPGDPSTIGGGWNNVPPAFTTAANGAVSWTTDHSLIRKFEVETGDIAAADPFDPSVEYDSIPAVIINDEGFQVGNWESLGTHASTCDPNSTSIRELPGFKMNFYPNPAMNNGTITIKSEKELQKVELIDITGKVVQSTSVANLQITEIAIQDFNSGIYFLKTTSTDNAVSTRKLVIQ